MSGHAEETREAILRCALAALARSGFEGTTLQGVAAAAGLSKGAVTHHFASKDDLLDAVILRCAEVVAGELASAAESEPSPGDRLRALAHALRAAWSDDRDEGRVMAMVAAAALYDPRVRVVSEGAFAAISSVLSRAIGDAAASAGLRPRVSVDAVARWLLGAGVGARLLQGGPEGGDDDAALTLALYAFFEL
ncbi:MAG: TetR/AcrR family transcriptional regulator [Polyangiales bacterium]